MTTAKSENRDQREILVKYWIEKARESLESAENEYGEDRLAFAFTSYGFEEE